MKEAKGKGERVRRRGKAQRPFKVADVPAKKLAANTKENPDSISYRTDKLEVWRERLKATALENVHDWYDLFALGRRNVSFRLLYPIARKPLNLDEMSDIDVIETASTSPEFIGLEGTEERLQDAKDGLYFWERCKQIYSEEMEEAERLAAIARERAAQRIDKEFGGTTSGVAKALRANHPRAFFVSRFYWD